MKRIISIMAVVSGIVLAIIGIITKTKESASITVIGGADGPTSIFLAGKLGSGFSVGTILPGIILFITGVVIYKVINRNL